MQLATLLNPDLIFFNLEGNDRNEIYSSIISAMKNTIGLPCPQEQILHDIIEREDSIHIKYECGFAYPHVRYPYLKDLNIVIGVLAKPVLLQPTDKQPTQIVICSLISTDTSVIYLKILSAFSRYFLSSPDAAKKLAATGSPKAFIEYLQKLRLEVKHTLSAEDVMQRDIKTVRPDEPISHALDIMAAEKAAELPVVNDAGELVGLISTEMIIRRAIPDYIMRLENLNFLSQFEPFETVLKEETNTLIRDVMKRDLNNTVSPQTPLIQFTMRLLKEKENVLFVKQDAKLVGIISFMELVSNVLRG